MALSKIKPEFAKTYVAFGTGTGPLGERQDIDDLAISAMESNDRSVINYFESAPPLEDLKRAKAEGKLSAKGGIGATGIQSAAPVAASKPPVQEAVK